MVPQVFLKFLSFLRFGIQNKIVDSIISKEVQIGKNLLILESKISGKNISIGDDTSIAQNCQILSKFKSISIGDRVSIGPNVLIQNYSHNKDYLITSNRVLVSNFGQNKFQEIIKETSKQITIGDDVWIGANTVIFPGSSIGSGAIIGANSIVKGKIPSLQIWAGSPVKFISNRDIK